MIMVFSLAACGNDSKNDKTESSSNSSQVDDSIAKLTPEQKSLKAKENVLEYLNAKYESTMYIVEDVIMEDDEPTVLVPVKSTYEPDGIYYYVLTDISKSGEDNINFCKDNFQSTSLNGWTKRIFCELMDIQNIYRIEEWYLVVNSDMFWGIEYKTSGLYTAEDLSTFLNKLSKDGYKLYIRVLCRYNGAFSEFRDIDLNDEQKKFLNAFEKIEFISAEEYNIDANKIENIQKDFETGCLPYITDLSAASRYDKASQSFVEIPVN